MAQVHALMDQAVPFFDARRYREAIELCDEIERLDPTAAMPEIMRNEYRRVVRKRRARRAALFVGALVVALGATITYRQLSRIRASPGQGPIEVAETQELTFQFASGFGAHERLEFTWALLAADGRPAPEAEQRHLQAGRNEPWSCTYAPGHGTVGGGAPGGSVTRRVVAIAVDGDGEQAARVEWVVVVRDDPQPPRILATQPSPKAALALAPGGSHTFRVEAEDGDGGGAVAHEWLVGNEARVVSTEPTWAYRRPPTPGASPPQVPRTAAGCTRQLVVCRVANRAGSAEPIAVTWILRLVDSNIPPEILAIEPDLRGTITLHPQRVLNLEAVARDRDRDDRIAFTWEFDGAVVSQTAHCTLLPPVEPSDARKTHHLRLVVADMCGATVERAWPIVVGIE